MSHQLFLPSPVVKMSNLIARQALPEGNQELELLMRCIAEIRYEDKDINKVYTFPVSELGYGNKLGGREYKRLKKAITAVGKSGIVTDNEDEIGYSPFFINLKLVKHTGIIHAKFHEDMKPFLIRLVGHFTTFELLQLSMLPSEYSKRLFILLKSYGSLDNGITLVLDELHDILKTPNSMKSDFSQFRLRILEKAKKDLKKVLFFDWKPIKKGRSVVAVHFMFRKSQIAEQQKIIEIREKDKATKKGQNASKLMIIACNCAEDKDGICKKRTQKKAVCAMCDQFNLCNPESIQQARKAREAQGI